MKKLVIGILAVATIALAAAPQYFIRFTLAGGGNMESEPGTFETVYFEKNNDLQAQLRVREMWSDLKIGFTPSKSGTVRMVIRQGRFAHEGTPELAVTNLKVSGATIKNTDFAKVDKKRGLPVGWKGKKESFRKVYDHDAAVVGGANTVATSLQVEAGQPVTINFTARALGVIPAVIPPRPAEYPADANAVYDARTKDWRIISVGRLFCRPTFENCGVYVNRKKSEIGKKLTAQLFYRVVGEKEYTQGMDLLEIRQENAWRGSILQLKENTEYEVKVRVSGEVNDEIYGKFRTRNSEVPIARTIELKPEEFKGHMQITKGGSEKGWIRYTMRDGETLKGDAKKQAVLHLNGAKFVVLENLVIDANKTPGGVLLENCENIIIRKCEIFNHGRDGERRLDKLGTFCTPDGRTIYHDPGIEITKCADVLVEKCFIHNPNAYSNTWLFSHPAGPSALQIQNCEGIVLRYNDLVGGDLHRFIDIVHGPGNGTYDGGFKRDGDVYGNLMIFSDDDAIELEGGEMNLRAYFNRFEGTFCGTSTGSAQLGPVYIFRNLYINPNDEEGRCGSAFKNGLERQGYGTICIFNNTAPHNRSNLAISGFGCATPGNDILPVRKFFFVNNLIASGQSTYANDILHWPGISDYNVYQVRDKSNLSEEIKGNRELGADKNSRYTDLVFRNAKNGDYRIPDDATEFQKVFAIPGMKIERAGAFQPDGIVNLPYRPLPLTADTNELRFAGASGSATFVINVGGKNFKEPFTVRQNEEFFTISETSGVFESGKSYRFTVKLNPEKMAFPRPYAGVILLRCASGYSYPVTVYADNSGDVAKKAAIMKQHAIVIPVKLDAQNHKFETEVEIPRSGFWFIMARDKSNVWDSKGKHIYDGRLGKTRFAKRGNIKVTKIVRDKREYTSLGGLSAQYFKLKAGKQPLSIEIDDEFNGEIDQIIITQHPELFTWHRE